MTWAKGIFAITLFVADLQRAKAFYMDTFGLPPINEDPESVVFSFGGTLINLLAIDAAPELVAPATVGTGKEISQLQFTIEVDDVDALCDELKSKGIALLNGPIDRPWGPRTATFQDPDGYIWEIAH